MPNVPRLKGFSRTERRLLLVSICLLAALAAYPLWGDDYDVAALRDVMLFGLFALSLDFLWGKTGTLSFGHATFFGLGAYGVAVVAIRFGLDPIYASAVGLACGVALAGLLALAVGYFLIFGGVRGAYFTIVTLALTIIAQHVAIGWASVTGGDAGLIGVPPLGFAVGGIELSLADPRASTISWSLYAPRRLSSCGWSVVVTTARSSPRSRITSCAPARSGIIPPSIC